MRILNLLFLMLTVLNATQRHSGWLSFYEKLADGIPVNVRI